MPQTGAAVSRDQSTEYDEPVASGVTRGGVAVPGAPGERGSTVHTAPGAGIPGRRTVAIRGRGAERYVPRRRGTARRPREPRYERAGFRPDRAALWAVALGVLLILVAATSAHAAALAVLH